FDTVYGTIIPWILLHFLYNLFALLLSLTWKEANQRIVSYN
ncbi:hypothetical protein A5867_003440, partial [Enterococcus sp. 6D12_DIV0197]